MSNWRPGWQRGATRRAANKRARLAERQGTFDMDGEPHILCPICKHPVRVAEASFDHIIPIARGGHPTADDNLQLICRACNLMKGSRLPWELDGSWGLIPGRYAKEESA